MKCSHCAIGKKLYTLDESSASYLGKLPNGKYLIIESIPCLICPNCGEEYFSTTIAEKMDAILGERNASTEKVKIMDFANAA